MKSENAVYTGFEFEVDGYPALAIINRDLKNVDDRSSYGYSVFILLIPDNYNENGHPEGEEYDYLNKIEKEIIAYLENETETVHVGHTTAYRAREIIFYTKNKEAVESFLDYYLAGIERESDYEIQSDPGWTNVAPFYELI
jgi:hypothetical protein